MDNVNQTKNQLARLGVCLTAVLVGGTLLAPQPATAQEFRFNAEPAAGFWLDHPQDEHFTPGFYMALRPGIALGRVVTLQASYSLFATPPGEGFTELGTAHEFSGGVRLRPLATLSPPEDQLGGLFVDVNAGYVRTGELDRFGFDAGLGYNLQATKWLALGPVLRYSQIVQPDDNVNEDPNDAQFLTLWLNLAFGPAYHAEEKAAEMTCPEAPACVQQPQEPAPVAIVEPCADHDLDGVCDSDDMCLNQLGTAAAFGCPIDPCGGKPLAVLVQFPYDSASLPVPRDDDPQTMDPVLDAVAAAIFQDPSCRVCIVGHASEEGAEGYNLGLSEKRADAVEGYLSARGLAASRMPTTGLGESCQLIPQSSRTMNRRVEFRRLQEGEVCPSQCGN